MCVYVLFCALCGCGCVWWWWWCVCVCVCVCVCLCVYVTVLRLGVGVGVVLDTKSLRSERRLFLKVVSTTTNTVWQLI